MGIRYIVAGMCFLSYIAVWSQDLPVKKIVIYKNGISYVERETILDGEGTIKLKFKARHMKDILKTLFAVPLQKGIIQNIDYQSEEPLHKKLEDIRIPLSPERTLTELLKGLQGVKINLVGRDITVTILGVETIKTITQNGQIIETPLLVGIEEGTNVIRTWPFDNLDFTIEDKNIKKDFDKLLSILNSTKFADQKEVTIYYKDFAKSPVKVGYVVESPIWKTTYRIFLDAKPTALLQSFAIVENDTLDDWKDVKITLVGSGPFSYHVDLYTAIVPSRPTISIGDLFGIVMPSSQRKLVEERDVSKARMKDRRFALEKMEYKEDYEVEAGILKEVETVPSAKPLGDIMAKHLRSVSQGREMGEYFSYEITQPVTILRGNAGLLNIINENIDGEKILYYKDMESRDVFNAFYLKNSSNNVLDNGFVTFFEGESSVGEGYLKTQLKKGEKEIITYGIEKSVRVETSENYPNSGYISIKLTNGVLVAQYYAYREKVYKIFNNSTKPYTLILDHSKMVEWELIEPADTTIKEELPNIYRFKVSLQSNSIIDFRVKERKLLSETIYIDINNLERIAFLISSGKLSAEAKKIVGEAIKILKEVSEIEKEIVRLQDRNAYLNKQLELIRNNIYALNLSNPDEAKVRSKHVANMDKYVTEYEENENKRNELIKKKNELLQNLSRVISSYSE